MEEVDNLDPILYTKLRKGTRHDQYVYKEEVQQIQNSMVLLSEIPQQQDHVTIEDSDNSIWYEIYDGVPEDNEFIVDYNYGVVRFNPQYEGKTLKFIYSGIGVTYVNAKRLFTTISPDGSILETIQSIIDQNRVFGNVLHKLPPVQNYNDIATAYPFPTKGDMTEVLTGEEANRLYIYNGTEWQWFLSFPFAQVMQNTQELAALNKTFIGNTQPIGDFTIWIDTSVE